MKVYIEIRQENLRNFNKIKYHWIGQDYRYGYEISINGDYIWKYI